MKAPPKIHRRTTLLTTLVTTLFCALLSGCTTPEKSGLYAHDAYIKTAVPGRSMTAAYVSLTNHEPLALCLSAFSAPFARGIELHVTEPVGDPASGRVAMRQLPELCVEPGQTAVLAPGGMHLMVMGLGELPPASVPMILGTTDGRAFEVQFAVKPFNHMGE